VSLFPDDLEDETTAAVLARVRAERLMVSARSYLPDVEVSDAYLLEQLRVAERRVEGALLTFLEPVEVLPIGATDAERDAFDKNGVRWIEEPGYDLDLDFWRVNNYGWTALRQAPVIRIHSVRFVYPSPAEAVFEVPGDWLRLDKKPGYLRLFPTGGAMLAPLAGYLGPMLMAGSTIPQMIQIRYQTGLVDVPTQYPHLLDAVYKMAVITILQDLFLPSSFSQSVDGISQSLSVDVDKHAESLAHRLDSHRDRIKGILLR
jgi:hypothetical protein